MWLHRLARVLSEPFLGSHHRCRATFFDLCGNEFNGNGECEAENEEPDVVGHDILARLQARQVGRACPQAPKIQ